VIKRQAGVRIFTTVNVDHISIEADEWEPLCGQKSKWGYRPAPILTPSGVRLCARCKALHESPYRQDVP
jgi:hypothetical protein